MEYFLILCVSTFILLLNWNILNCSVISTSLVTGHEIKHKNISFLTLNSMYLTMARMRQQTVLMFTQNTPDYANWDTRIDIYGKQIDLRINTK